MAADDFDLNDVPSGYSGPLSGQFPIGTTTSKFLVTEWYPDPKVVEADLLHFSHGLENMYEPLEKAKAAMIYSTEVHFEDHVDPYGFPWVPLQDEYARWKEKHGGSNEADLVLSDDLRKAVISPSTWQVIGNDVVIKVDKLPPYGPYHQEGTIGTVKGQLFKRASGKSGKKQTEAENLAEAKGERGLNLPQRQFIGLDVDTIAEIEDIFLKWIDGLIEEDWIDYVTPPPVEYGEYSGGRFPVAGYTKRGQPLLRTPRGIRFGRIPR